MHKIKQFIESDKGKDIFVVIIVILVGLGSFGLGRLSNESTKAGIKITYPDQIGNVTSTSDSTVNISDNSQNSTSKNIVNTITTKTTIGSTSSVGKPYFASKIGQKYYSIGCSGGKTIKQENRIYFATEAEAQSAGFEKSSTCK